MTALGVAGGTLAVIAGGYGGFKGVEALAGSSPRVDRSGDEDPDGTPSFGAVTGSGQLEDDVTALALVRSKSR